MYFKIALGNVRRSIRDYGVYFLTPVSYTHLDVYKRQEAEKADEGNRLFPV